jgi:ABC-type multidrug transport system ATPase subunit
MAELLEADQVRIDVGGSPAVDGLSLASAGDHVLVLGAPRALAEAVSGVRPVVRGALRVRGAAPTDALEAGAVAASTGDAPIPPKWTVREYVGWSARLVGNSRSAAKGLASDAIARMKLEDLEGSLLAKAPLVVRRATVIAAALATAAPTIVLDDPLAGLSDAESRTLARVLSRALDDRASIVFAARMDLASPLALHADEAIMLAGSRVFAQGAPAEIAAKDRTYALRVDGDSASFARALHERGGRVDGAPQAMIVTLGELTTRDLFSIALASNAVVVELRPVGAGLG